MTVLNGLIIFFFLLMLYIVFRGGFDFALGPLKVQAHSIKNPLIFITILWCLRLFLQPETAFPLRTFIRKSKYFLITLVLIFTGFNLYQYIYVKKSVAYEHLSSPEVRNTGARVALIGLDGLSWRMLDPLLKQGRLPNLQRLIEEGSRGKLGSLLPTWSPSIWTSAATGFSIKNHGVGHFLTRDPVTFEYIPVSSTQRTRLAIWNIASKLSKTVGVVAYYVTWPAEEVKGFIISDRYMHKIPRKTYPPELTGALGKISSASDFDPARFYNVSVPRPEGTLFESSEEVLRGAYKRDKKVTSMAVRNYEKYDPDLLMVYLRGTDAVSHYFWKYRFPEEYEGTGISLDGLERYKDTINDFYIYTDQLVGKILDILPPETTIIIASDHGFETDRRLLVNPKLDSIFEKLGLLAYLDREEGEINWAQTVVYDNDFRPMVLKRRAVNINLQGREPSGIVRPEDYETILASVINALYTVKGAKTGTPFLSVIRSTQDSVDLEVTIHGEDFPDEEIVIAGETYDIVTFLKANPISGTHGNAPEGVIIVSGKGIEEDSNINRKKVLFGDPFPRASILDLTPTMLYMLGLPVGKDMDGQVLVNAFTRDYLKDHPVTTIPSYEVFGRDVATVPVSSEADEEIKEELRQLGYIH